jgi:hypothetical protein
MRAISGHTQWSDHSCRSDRTRAKARQHARDQKEKPWQTIRAPVQQSDQPRCDRRERPVLFRDAEKKHHGKERYEQGSREGRKKRVNAPPGAEDRDQPAERNRQQANVDARRQADRDDCEQRDE